MDLKKKRYRFRARSRSRSTSSSSSSSSDEKRGKRGRHYKRSKSGSSRSSSRKHFTPDKFNLQVRHSSKRLLKQKAVEKAKSLQSCMTPVFPDSPFASQGIFPVGFQDEKYRGISGFHPFPDFRPSYNYTSTNFRDGILPHVSHRYPLNIRPHSHGNALYTGSSWEIISRNVVPQPPLEQRSFPRILVHHGHLPHGFEKQMLPLNKNQTNKDNIQNYLPSICSSDRPSASWSKADDLKLQPINKDLIQDCGPSHSSVTKVKQEAIDQELLQQKKTLLTQREDYIKQKISINNEIHSLINEIQNISKDNSSDSEQQIQENNKNLTELQQKLKSVDNVIEMLTGIIGDKENLSKVIKQIENKDSNKYNLQMNHSWIESKNMLMIDENGFQEEMEGNRVYYDSGLYWCKFCNVFPKTLSDYLDHIHSFEHKNKSILKFEDYPWHTDENLHDEKRSKYNKGIIPKRTPIRGVQFLIPSNAVFCSLCKEWLGDNHCAIKHVQSYQHSKNYKVFILKNPHWEVDWLTERTKSFERNAEIKELRKLQPTAVNSTSLAISSLSDQLLALIAANQTVRIVRSPVPPPPPPIRSPMSSSSSCSREFETPPKKKKLKKKGKLLHQIERLSITPKQSSTPMKSVHENPLFLSKWVSDEEEDLKDKRTNNKIEEEKRKSKPEIDVNRETTMKSASFIWSCNNSHKSSLDENKKSYRSKTGNDFQHNNNSKCGKYNKENSSCSD